VTWLHKEIEQTLEDKGDNKFIPKKDKMWFKELSGTSNITARELTEVVVLYAACVTYNEMCAWNCEVTEPFSWIIHNDGKWPEVQTTAELKWDSLQLIMIIYLMR
jgi:hypothetical protein